MAPTSRIASIVTSALLCLSCGLATGQTSAVQTKVLQTGLAQPTGMAFLPDGRMLVTQKRGQLVVLSENGSRMEATVTGLPEVHSAGQGGLFDVAIDPDFEKSPWVYLTYAEVGEGGLSGTAVARGKWQGGPLPALQDLKVIYRQTPKRSGNGHYGGRLVFRKDGTLWVTLGERMADNPSKPDEQHAQHLGNSLGKVIRIHKDGRIPNDNPFLRVRGALPELWSYGHRNPQGAALNPDTGELYVSEHGPQGGDEINRVVPGANYGWPLRSYGCPYGAPVGNACRVGGGTHAPSYTEPLTYWVPTSIAPAGMVFYTGHQFPQWTGQLFVGALAGQALWRIELQDGKVSARERLLSELRERIRHVSQGPDGWLYLLTDSGKLIRLERP